MDIIYECYTKVRADDGREIMGAAAGRGVFVAVGRPDHGVGGTNLVGDVVRHGFNGLE